ncbi:26087_t:CDS:2, partial [Gigaspora rosea]
HVEACIVCHKYPKVRLQSGVRSPYCGKQCQAKATAFGSRTQIQTQYPVSSVGPHFRPAVITSPVSNLQSNRIISVPPLPPPRQPTGTINQQYPMNQPTQVIPPTNPRNYVPICAQCKQKACWKDQNTGIYSLYCGKTCREKATGANRMPQSYNSFSTTIASNGIPSNGIPTQIGIQQQPTSPLNMYQASPVGIQQPIIPMNVHQQTRPLNIHQQPSPNANIRQQSPPVSVQQQAALNIQPRSTSLNVQRPNSANVHQRINPANVHQRTNPANVHQRTNPVNGHQRQISQQSIPLNARNRQRQSYQ